MEKVELIRRIELSYADLQLCEAALLDYHVKLSRDFASDEWDEHELRRLEYLIGVINACFDSCSSDVLGFLPVFSCSIGKIK